MIPIRDSIPTSSRAYVTVGLILLNVLVFLMEVTGNMQEMVWKYGYVPGELVTGRQDFLDQLEAHPPARQAVDRLGRPLVDFFGRPLLEPDVAAIKAATSLPAWLNIFTCMFLHGGWAHLIGNMLYLWIFGNNIEDRLGPVLYLAFYIITGLVGNIAHTIFDPGFVPLIGASGATSGVMGAYILLYPRARILALVPVGWYPMTVSLPAWVFLGFFFVIQNLYPAYFTATHFSRGPSGGVAYLAHVGGFISGAVLILLFPRRKRPPPATPAYDPDKDDADVVI
jgi:membrane associated rhomboid family serine protease